MSRTKDFLFNNIAVQKWIVLFFDTVLGALSFLLSGYLAALAAFPSGSMSLRYQLLLVTCTYALFFLFFKTGDARPQRTGFKNALRSLDAISAVFISLMLLNLFLKMTGRSPLISNVQLIATGVISVFLIGGYRFIASLYVKNGLGSTDETKKNQIIDRLNDDESVQQHHSTSVLQLLKTKTILITGAAGSIGSSLSQQAAAFSRSRIIFCDINETGLYELEYTLTKKYPSAKLTFLIADIRDEATFENIFKQYHPQVVIHAAAYKHVPMMEAHPGEAVRNNVHGTRVLADLALKYRTERFLFVSTDKAINPANVMGATKRIAEMYVQAIGNTAEKQLATKFITTRFGNVLGSNGSVIPRFKEQIAAGGPVTITHPDITRYFMTLSEACALLLEAVALGKGSEVFRFDMGAPVRIADLANNMIVNAGLKPGVDIRVTYTGLRQGEKLFEEQLDEQEEIVPGTNNKILVANVPVFDLETINNGINHLMHAAAANNDKAVVRQMKLMVPEFISNNSVYEALDKKNVQVGANIS